jgi:hypothetical protein
VYTLIGFLPLFLSFVFIAACIKLAAFLFRRTKVAWSQAFIYTAGMMVITVALRFGLVSIGISLPWFVALPLGLALHLVFGDLYFASRAQSFDGDPIGRVRALQLSGIVFLVLLGLSVVGMAISTAMLSGRGDAP